MDNGASLRGDSPALPRASNGCKIGGGEPQPHPTPAVSAEPERRGHFPVQCVRDVEEDPVAAVALPVASEQPVQDAERDPVVHAARPRRSCESRY